jgi:hypothetical protein
MRTPRHFVVYRVTVITITVLVLLAVGFGAERFIHDWYANGWPG